MNNFKYGDAERFRKIQRKRKISKIFFDFFISFLMGLCGGLGFFVSVLILIFLLVN